MNVASLKRDPDRINANLMDGKDGSIITKVPCKIMIPARFVERGLAALEPEVYTVCLYALIMEDQYYTVCTVPSAMRLTPNEMAYVDLDGVQYIEMQFVKGAVVAPNVDLVVRNETVYYIYNELIAQGNAPWYLDKDDLGALYDSAPRFAEVRIGANEAVWEMVVSSILRDADDKMVYWRHTDKKAEPVTVPLRSVTYGPTNTPARLIGNHMKEAITVALVNPSDQVTPIEDQLRR